MYAYDFPIKIRERNSFESNKAVLIATRFNMPPLPAKHQKPKHASSLAGAITKLHFSLFFQNYEVTN